MVNGYEWGKTNFGDENNGYLRADIANRHKHPWNWQQKQPIMCFK